MKNSRMIYAFIIFLILNFGALAIGGLFTGSGVTSQWYQDLNQAPWTPPGWVFGFAWTTIMICFSFYMGYAWKQVSNHTLLISLFAIQWVLNVSWNPVFFQFHLVGTGLIVISLLTVLMIYMGYAYLPSMAIKSALVAPYIVWLLVATSLNAYIYFQN